MKPRLLVALLVAVSSLALVACEQAAGPPPEPAMIPIQVEQAIRNGTREPQVLTLSEGQKLAIGWLYDGQRVSRNFCTGTAIAPDLVVTAAHCTQGARPSELGFGVGLLPTDPAGYVGVRQKVEHPSLDVTLLLLERPLTEQVPELVPIAYNTRALVDEDEGQDVEAAGYGETYDRNRTGRYFARVELERVSEAEIVVNGNGQQGICFGDSGGPVMWMDPDGAPRVLAVESWGDPSCVGRDHMVRLDTLQPWIDAVARGETPPDPCQGLDFLGQCTAEDVAEWCQDGQLRQRDCKALGTTCDFVNNRVGYTCTCGDLTYYGRCDGDVASYCDRNRLVQVDCAERGLGCGLVDEETGYYCTGEPAGEEPAPTCVEGEALCAGDIARVCLGGDWVEEVCEGEGARCEEDAQGARCVSEPAPPDEEAPDAGADGGVFDGERPDAGAEPEGGAPPAGAGQVSGGGCSATPQATTPASLLLGLLAALGWVARR